MQESFSKESFLKNNKLYEAYKKAFDLITNFIIGYIYIRVSSKKQTDNSPEAQLRAILDYALQNKIWIPIENIFIDGGISGRKSDKRIEFQRLVSLALDKKSNCKVILVDKYDRFYRNKDESAKYKADIKAAGCSVIAIKQPLPKEKISALILENHYDTMAEIYSLNLSQEVYKGLYENADNGKHQTRPCYGYKKIIVDVIYDSKRDKDVIIRKMIIIEEESKVVIMIFTLYIDGMTELAIAQHLNELGIKTRDGIPWYDARVKYILNNPTYIGYSHWTKSGEDTIIKKSKDIPPIITQEMWAKKEEIRKARKSISDTPIKSYVKSEHWLRGKIRCSNCGNTLVLGGGSWQCCMYTHGGCNESHSIRIKMLEDLVLNQLSILNKNQIYININNIKAQNNQEDAILIEKIKALEDKKKKIEFGYENDFYSLEEAKEKKKQILLEQTQLEKKLKEINKEKNSKDYQDIIYEKCENLTDMLKDENIPILDKQVAINEVIDRIIFDKKNKTLEFIWKIL